MSKHDIAIVGLDHPYGLSSDRDVLTDALEGHGFCVKVFNDTDRGLRQVLSFERPADLVIHLENVHRKWLNAGRRNILIPNQEAFWKHRLWMLRLVDAIFVKTRHAEEIFKKFHGNTVFTGFGSPDKNLQLRNKDWNLFFHAATDTKRKGTEAVLDLWAQHPEWPQLVVKVPDRSRLTSAIGGNVKVIDGFLSETDLTALSNRYGQHLCPSRSEGFGHSLMEAMSTGSLVVTTDAPPMNELITEDCGQLVRTSHQQPRNLGADFFVDAASLERCIEHLIETPLEVKQRKGATARARYLAMRAAFIRRLCEAADIMLSEVRGGRSNSR